eukprot:CAMPEP_0119029290 /NCGR_PEP_ID=MMETSP1176-20130426/40437_1 /TAXON_ID=265551 /ORGANISM="Synedropsis recta cf, Strain CCMP1620" /LENGTH=56 /DNA_ID=CAMNT_0006985621 /DNA_START=421 /DNA_END=589 /DNA_ORIENTATION=+
MTTTLQSGVLLAALANEEYFWAVVLFFSAIGDLFDEDNDDKAGESGGDESSEAKAA